VESLLLLIGTAAAACLVHHTGVNQPTSHANATFAPLQAEKPVKKDEGAANGKAAAAGDAPAEGVSAAACCLGWVGLRRTLTHMHSTHVQKHT
jgi:hypothetical protein